jgi:hypothetical protein
VPRFSHLQRVLTAFLFLETPMPHRTVAHSNAVPVCDGQIQLTKRFIHAVGPNDGCVLGVSIASATLWLVRVVSVHQPRTVDIMAGSTKSDYLRVPKAFKGTWTDLMPVPSDFATRSPVLFIMEYLYLGCILSYSSNTSQLLFVL